MLEGICSPDRFLALVRDFIVFEDDGSGALAKKMAGYHQFHAVRVAVDETLRAAELQRASKGVVDESRRRYESGVKPRRGSGRPPNRGGLAHSGVGQEPDDGLLRRGRHTGACDGEPDGRGAHRPQRPGTTSSSAPSPAAKTCCASRRPKRRAAPTCEASSR